MIASLKPEQGVSFLQIVRAQHAVAVLPQHALDRVLQLANVAGPIVSHHGPANRFADAAYFLRVLTAERLDEMRDEQWDVFAALAQRRQTDGCNLQAKVQILAK